MKKLIFLFILFLIPFSVSAERIEVKFSKCVDGDTANVILKKKEIKIRFLAVDTPESVHPTKGEEPFGKEASEYTCKKLTNAKKIEIEYDPKSDKTDKYDRHLVWLYVDNKLFQKDLVSKGYAKIAYLYDDYLYVPDLEKAQEKAKNSKLKIWSDYVETKEKKDDNKTIVDYIVDFLQDFFNKLIKYIRKKLEAVL